MLETEFRVGLQIGFFTNAFFTSGYGLSGPRVLCRIGRIVCLSGLLATAPEALRSIGLPIISSMTFVYATIWFAEIAFDASRVLVGGIAFGNTIDCRNKLATLPRHKLDSGGRLSSSWTLSGEWESVVDAYRTLSVHRKVGGSIAVVAACVGNRLRQQQGKSAFSA